MSGIADLPGSSVDSAGASTEPRAVASRQQQAGRCCARELPHRPAAVAMVRRTACAILRDWGLVDEDVDSVVLVLSELVTNAIEHALPPVTVRMEAADGEQVVHIEVCDGGPASQEGEWAASCEPEEHGRGEGIVEALATARGMRVVPEGTVYWADLPAPALAA